MGVTDEGFAEHPKRCHENSAIVVETLKVKIRLLQIELRDALWMAYGEERAWPESAVMALGKQPEKTQ